MNQNNKIIIQYSKPTVYKICFIHPKTVLNEFLIISSIKQVKIVLQTKNVHQIKMSTLFLLETELVCQLPEL